MKLLIDIPEHVYEHAKEMSEDSRDEGEAMRAIANGSPQEGCGDAISRQAVLEGIRNLYPDIPIADIMGARRKWLEKYAPYFECENVVEQLPSVTPQQRTGRWKRMTKEELIEKIEKEEKWLIHALNDQTDATSSYSVDIAFDAVKHYVKDYINSQQKEVEE